MNLSPTPSNRLFSAESPKPGEIWGLKPSPNPQVLDPGRSVMIVNVIESDEVQEMGDRPLSEPMDEPIITVMVLAKNPDCFSEADVRIPAAISGLDPEVVAQTWHVFPISGGNLAHRVGLRLSRPIYDGLLTLGDAYHGLIDEVPSPAEIEQLGLQIGSMPTSHPDFLSFRQTEAVWSDGLSVAFTGEEDIAPRALKLAEAILEEARQWEQDWIHLHAIHPEPFDRESSNLALGQQVNVLSQWFQRSIAPEWQKISRFWELQHSSFAMARSNALSQTILAANPDRGSGNADEIEELLYQLAIAQDDSQYQRIVQRLGMIAKGHPDAIQAIIAILDHTLNDETLWLAVESLNRMDPDNFVNISRFKAIDLGMQVSGQSVRLVVSLFQKANQQVSVLLRVYPSEKEFVLPLGLKLVLLDLAGQVLREVTARESDIYIQLKLSGHRDEAFSVKIALQEASITESFLI